MASIIKVDQILENTTGVGTNFATTGSASTPTISIGNQTNKGFYHSATDKIGVSVGGNEILNFNSLGISRPVSEFDSWYLTSSISYAANAPLVLANNWTREALTFSKIGTGLSQSSGIFSFPKTGMYLIFSQFYTQSSSNSAYGEIYVDITINNSTYNIKTISETSYFSSIVYQSITSITPINVTDITNIKFRFRFTSGTNVSIIGDTTTYRSYFSCIRLGDST